MPNFIVHMYRLYCETIFLRFREVYIRLCNVCTLHYATAQLCKTDGYGGFIKVLTKIYGSWAKKRKEPRIYTFSTYYAVSRQNANFMRLRCLHKNV